MLYVVFTFGEMIIAISEYFEAVFTPNGFYFALMAFLIVVGLFLSYGYFYDHIIDREKETNGLWYMFLHIFLIFALSNITNGLEFMREEEIALKPKLLFITFSIIAYFATLFAVGVTHAKMKCCLKKPLLYVSLLVLAAAFAILMFVFREKMAVNIALTVVFVFSCFLSFFISDRKSRKSACLQPEGKAETKE